MNLRTYLIATGEALNGPAFYHDDLKPLTSRVTRGQNLVMPTAEGQRPYLWIREQIDVTITWYAKGRFDLTGAAAADPEAQLDITLDHVEALFTDGPDPAGLVAATIVRPSTSLSGDIQVVAYDPVKTSTRTATVLTRILVPAGRWDIDDS